MGWLGVQFNLLADMGIVGPHRLHDQQATQQSLAGSPDWLGVLYAVASDCYNAVGEPDYYSLLVSAPLAWSRFDRR